jgi:DNA-binding transcriptional ArsR family regulator
MKWADPDVLMLAALADPNRLEIVRQLGLQVGLTCACDFTECCAVSQPTVSHHLKVLRDAGVVVSERRGTNIYYSLAPGFAERFRSLGASIGGLVQIG